MSDYENPYQSPETPIVPETSQSSGASLSETMLRYLNEASPWLRFVGVMGYIGAGLMCLGGIISAIIMLAASSFAEEIGVFTAWIFIIIYLPMGVLMFFPAHFTYSFGQKIHNYKFSNSGEELEMAFKNNKSLWKFTGIIYIISLASIPVIIVVSIIIGVAAAANFF
ncbi:MAG: DUF5362 domain-containing protein [Treponema sp.]|jgi:hypothetical protein|nr:DUF5362 domain-containing protein [Treponema sp.]